jgi:hypothetical protein
MDHLKHISSLDTTCHKNILIPLLSALPLAGYKQTKPTTTKVSLVASQPHTV